MALVCYECLMPVDDPDGDSIVDLDSMEVKGGELCARCQGLPEGTRAPAA